MIVPADLSAPRVDYTINENNNVTFTFELLYDSTSLPVDITSYSFTVYIKTARDGTDVLSKALTITSAVNGQFQFTITDANWTTIAGYGLLWYEIQMIDDLLAKRTYQEGNLNILNNQ